MIDGATKIPDPMTLPTMSIVASRSPRPRTSGTSDFTAGPCAVVFTACSGAAEVLDRLGDRVLGGGRVSTL